VETFIAILNEVDRQTEKEISKAKKEAKFGFVG